MWVRRGLPGAAYGRGGEGCEAGECGYGLSGKGRVGGHFGNRWQPSRAEGKREDGRGNSRSGPSHGILIGLRKSRRLGGRLIDFVENAANIVNVPSGNFQ